MADVLINSSTMTAIASAIRTKKGVSTTYKPAQMPDAISSISTGITPTGTKSITANGTYDVTEFASAEVNVPTGGSTPTGTKQISITSNGTTTEDVASYANAQITVNVPTGGGGGTVIETGSFGASRSFQLDMKSSWFDNYDLIIIHISGTVSASDWIYMIFNNTAGADYSNQVSSFDWYGVADKFVINQIKAMFSSNRATAFSSNAQYLYMYTYNANNTIAGTYEIIGHNVL